jgi:PAS domain S-box-containing protein
VFAITLVYAGAEFLRSPAQLRAALLLYLVQLTIPAVFLWLARGPWLQQNAEWSVLVADLAYTSALALRLFLPTEPISGVALFLSLKMVATAILFPWNPRFQAISAASTVTLYCTFLAGSGRTIEFTGSLHQLLGPVVAALLSIVGAFSVDGMRRALFEDIIGRKRTEAALRESEAELRLLMGSISDYVWSADIDANGQWSYRYYSPGVEQITGRPPDFYLTGPDRWLSTLVPEDRAGIAQALQRLTDGRSEHEEAEYRIVVPDGTMRWVRDSVVVRTLAPGRLRVDGVVTDITDRKRAEEDKAVLLEIARDISGTLDLDALLDRVQRRITALLPCDRIITYYWDTDRAVYRPLAWHGVPADLVPDTIALEFQRGQPVVEELLGGNTVVINDAAHQHLVPGEVLTHFGLTAVVLVPLAVHDRRVGALAALTAESGRHFDTRQVQLLEGIGRQVGVAIETTEMYRAQQLEAEVAGALAQVGQAMISSLDTPVLLNRLCQLTTQALGCDFTHAYLWDKKEDVFVPVASYGDRPEDWEALRVLRLPRAMLSDMFARLERDGLVQIGGGHNLDLLPHGAQAAYGVTLGMFVALRRGAQIIGVHSPGYRGREQPFAPAQERIAKGIAQLASLALENARLVEALERASRLKSEFVATMSHELRTPLNIIIGYAALLLEDVFGKLGAEQTDVVQRVDRSAQELLELINTTLDISRFESGQVALDLNEFALADLMREIHSETDALWNKSDLRVSLAVPPTLPQLRTDRVKLKVVLKNLIGNAIKFTDRGSVVVDACAHDGGIQISVADTGIGIAPEALPIIFEPFRQADSSMTRRHGGVGLGLYIVQQLVNLLGGTITVDSELGRGSTFRVWVPCDAGLSAHGSPL